MNADKTREQRGARVFIVNCGANGTFFVEGEAIVVKPAKTQDGMATVRFVDDGETCERFIDPAAQADVFDFVSYAAGFTDGIKFQMRRAPERAATIRECWRAINAHISQGPLPGNGTDQTAERNGLVLATNILNGLFSGPEGRAEATPTAERSGDHNQGDDK